MARLRLSTGILSPLQSDISTNDASAFSFDSITSTPEFEKEMESSQNKHTRKELDFNFCHNNPTTENSPEFELVMRDFKKNVNINAKREEKFKNTYERLKHSFDELFPKKMPDLSFHSPIYNYEDFESVDNLKSFDLRTEGRRENVKHLQEEGACFSPIAESQFWADAASPKVEKSSLVDNSKYKKEKYYCQFESASEKNESKVKLNDELDSRKKEESLKSHRTKSSEIRTTSSQTCESFLQTASAKFNSDRNQNTAPTTKVKPSSDVQNIENRGMSIEKSIHIAVSMELDKIRSLMLDQKISLGKEMLKLQEMTRKQSEVMNSLITVIEDLVEENQKLHAARK